jgi:TrmH family RNA methyltransferase
MISKNHVKHIQTLHSKKHRDEHAMFIIEGTKIVSEFLNSDTYQILEVLGVANFIASNLELLESKNIPFSEITEDDLKKISTQQSPNQVLALVKMQDPALKNQTKLIDSCLYFYTALKWQKASTEALTAKKFFSF